MSSEETPCGLAPVMCQKLSEGHLEQYIYCLSVCLSVSHLWGLLSYLIFLLRLEREGCREDKNSSILGDEPKTNQEGKYAWGPAPKQH